jgi:hypothetical protein
MSDESVTRDLFDRWERVWHEGQYDLVPGCVAPTYLRHDALGDRTVTPESYAAELARMKADRYGAPTRIGFAAALSGAPK